MRTAILIPQHEIFLDVMAVNRYANDLFTSESLETYVLGLCGGNMVKYSKDPTAGEMLPCFKSASDEIFMPA